MDRSRSNSRERERRRHKKHKHKHRRSRSRSRSYERGGGGGGPSGIHLNPAFGHPPPPQIPNYASQASQLLQQNNMMEAEICRLKNALLSEQGHHQIEIQRNTMLQQELRNAQIQREQATKRCNEIMSERRMMMDMKTEMANRINQLEVGHRHLRDDVAAARLATEAKNEEIRAITYQSEIVGQQIAALNERNAALKSKCETMVGAQRKQYEEMEAKQKLLDTANLNVRKIEQDLQCASIEIQRLNREVESVHQMESSSLFERQKFDEILARKEDEIRVFGYKSAAELKAANEKIENLENRLKQEKPMIYDDMTVFQETIYVAIETIKSTYEQQLTRLEDEIQNLKNGAKIGEKMEEESDDVKILEDEKNGMEEGANSEQIIEELPSWLRTPMKPDPAKMGDLKKTIQCKINLDFEAEATPTTTTSSAHFERLPPVEVPLFGTTGVSTEIQDSEVMNSEDVKDSEEIQNPVTSSDVLDTVLSDSAHNYTEEDLLLAEPHGSHETSQDDLDAMEKQLLGDSEQ